MRNRGALIAALILGGGLSAALVAPPLLNQDHRAAMPSQPPQDRPTEPSTNRQSRRKAQRDARKITRSKHRKQPRIPRYT